MVVFKLSTSEKIYHKRFYVLNYEQRTSYYYTQTCL